MNKTLKINTLLGASIIAHWSDKRKWNLKDVFRSFWKNYHVTLPIIDNSLLNILLTELGSLAKADKIFFFLSAWKIGCNQGFNRKA